MKNILVTGGCGFIGSSFVNKLLEDVSFNVVNLDCLNYCANTKNVDEHSNYVFFYGNISDKNLVSNILENYQIDTVIHFAAQTHVDNSFENSLVYTMDNIVGTHILLECMRTSPYIRKFIHISTDEVYGDMGSDKKTENSVLCPTNPYAATKAGAELLVKSYYYSYGIPAIIIRSNNVYGPKQYIEKVIPKFITYLNEKKKCTIHGYGQTKRAFIYVDDVVNAIMTVLMKGEIGEIYNIGSDDEIMVIELLDILRKKICPDVPLGDTISYVSDRPYNDKRYYISDEKLKSLGWRQTVSFNEGIDRTIEWYKNITEDYWKSENDNKSI